jgi:hypothetical protein
MNSDKIFVSFEVDGRFHRGTLSPVSGMAAQRNDRFHLSIDGFYYGVLRRLESGWLFNNRWNWDSIAEELGRQVEEWEREH